MFRVRLAGPRWHAPARGSGGDGRGRALRPEGPTPPPDFGGGAAFRHKPLSQILRSLLVFRFCSHPLLVRNSAQLMAVSRRVLGKGLFDRMMRLTAYGQFVAGETVPEINETIGSLAQLGIRPMLAVPIEEDSAEQSRVTESWFDKNLQTMLNCVDLSAGNSPQPMMQMKLTALMSAELCRTVTFALQDKSCAQDLAVHRLVEVMDGKELTFTSLSETDAAHFCHSLRRLEKIGQRARHRDVRLLVDAEYRPLSPALSLLAAAMVTRFNRRLPLVWTTYQCYLKETLGKLVADIEQARGLSLSLGVKLVRGAYMDRERELAQRLGSPDPVHGSWEETTRSYHQALDVMLETVRETPRHRLLVASHNLSSVTLAMARMEELGIPRNQETVCFAQLLGMCDHISIGLGQAGYCVYKSIPYGPVEDVLPYLTRRAQENLSVLQGLRMERELHWQELRRRLFGKRGLSQ